MRNLTPEQARELRPDDLALENVPEGLDESKLPWSGHVEHDLVQDLASYWEVNSNFKADWVAFILTEGGTEIESPHRYFAYMALPEGDDKTACRTALLAVLTKRFEGHLTSWMLGQKKPQPRRPEDGPILIYHADGLKDDEVNALRVEISRALQDPHYTLITNFQIAWTKVQASHALIAEDASPKQVEYLREELRLAQEDRDYIPVVGFPVESLSLLNPDDFNQDDFNQDDVEMLDEIMGDKVEGPRGEGFGDPIPELVPEPTPEP